jgi:hypothetical protein
MFVTIGRMKMARFFRFVITDTNFNEPWEQYEL